MTIEASLVPGGSPALVQIVIDETPDGVPWEVYGFAGDFTPGLAPGDDLLPGDDVLPEDSVFTPSGHSWRVPGAFGVGDGDQVVLVDNRAPGNVPVSYRMVTAESVDESAPVVVPFEKDTVLQTLDGQRAVQGDLLTGSLGVELPTRVATFQVAGRARPVSRYDVLGDVSGAFEILLPMGDTTPFRGVLESGAPVVCRFGTDVADLERVSVIQVTRVSSPSGRAYALEGLRVWSIEYVIVDDPGADVRLGAFAWDQFDGFFDGLAWAAGFDVAFAGLSWDAFDTTVWE